MFHVRNPKAGAAVFVLFAVLWSAGCTERMTDYLPDALLRTKYREIRVSSEDLLDWQLVGKGVMKVDDRDDALIITEGAGSKGITLVSRESFGRDLIVSFDFMSMSFEGVNMAFLSASDKVTKGELKVPEDHRGNMDFWTDGRVQNYIFAFHNGYYESKPFIKKNPGLRNIAVAKNVVEGKKDSLHVEIGRRGQRLWIKIDGETVVKGRDKARGGLPGGKIGFRLRGPGSGSYTCRLKNVVILERQS